MAVTVVLSEIQRDTLAKVCDTFVPSIERDDDPTGFWGRSASDLSIPDAIEQQLAAGCRRTSSKGMRELLDALRTTRASTTTPQEAREQIGPRVRRRLGPEALAGVHAPQAG